MFNNPQYNDKTNTTYWFIKDQDKDFDITKYITKKNIDFLFKQYKITPNDYNRLNYLKITKCKHCDQIILSHAIREFCSQKCLRENITTRDNNHQLILKFERDYGILLDECSYSFIDENTLQYKPRPNLKRETYTITVDELLNIYKDKAKRTLYGTMMNKFYKIYKLKEEEWTDEQVDNLIEDIFEWLGENEDHITVTEYFRKHLINPLILRHLRETSKKFNDFFTEMEVYSESIVTNKALKGEFNGNFSHNFLKSRYPAWEDKSNTLTLNQLPITINLPSKPQENPKNLDISNNNPTLLGE